jgi:DNA end-binding protein Ku
MARTEPRAEKGGTSMARALWKGSISFGLVTIPVDLHAAVESREELSFHLLHRKDGSRIDYKRFCSKEDIEVPWKEIVKGYEYGKGQYAVLSDEDFAQARVEGTQTFAIRAFVPAKEIDALYFDHPYYLAPSGKGGVKAYALLRDALEETGRVGIGTIVLRQREHLAALEPAGRALALTTMRFSHELRSPKSLAVPQGGGYAKRELTMATQLIETLATGWDPTAYKDTYTEVLRQVIEQKISGRRITPAAPKRPAPVTDLRAALEQSLKNPRQHLVALEGGRRERRKKGRRAA